MKTRHAVSLAACALAVAACKKALPAGGRPRRRRGDHADEFKHRIEEQSPFLRARLQHSRSQEELLEALIRNELLAQEAQREGLDKTPAVRDATKRAMIQELSRSSSTRQLTGADIPDAELKTFLRRHLDDYVKPRARGLRHFLPRRTPGEGAGKPEGRRCSRTSSAPRRRAKVTRSRRSR